MPDVLPRHFEFALTEPSSLENNGAVVVHEYPVFEVPADGPGQNAPLHLAPQTHQVAHAVAVGNVGYVLVDYVTGVEFSVT